MTLMIDLTPALEKRLRAVAAKRGKGETETAREMLVQSLERAEAEPPHAAKVLTGYGFLAGKPGSSEEFALEKQREIALEERDW